MYYDILKIKRFFFILWYSFYDTVKDFRRNDLNIVEELLIFKHIVYNHKIIKVRLTAMRRGKWSKGLPDIRYIVEYKSNAAQFRIFLHELQLFETHKPLYFVFSSFQLWHKVLILHMWCMLLVPTSSPLFSFPPHLLTFLSPDIQSHGCKTSKQKSLCNLFHRFQVCTLLIFSSSHWTRSSWHHEEICLLASHTPGAVLLVAFALIL